MSTMVIESKQLGDANSKRFYIQECACDWDTCGHDAGHSSHARIRTTRIIEANLRSPRPKSDGRKRAAATARRDRRTCCDRFQQRIVSNLTIPRLEFDE